MGGVVSTGVDNDELVDKLKEADYIRTAIVEKVFRLVDRADYITLGDKKMAYKDSAWRSGNLHLSAPCIYAQAMEGLQIAEGMSFLNIGSGTGYLSAMAGLLIGPKGISHGVELHSDVIEYAHERLEWFKSHSGALDVMEFCEPIFIQGNAFCLPDDRPLYDRVYCGAACHDTHEKFMKHLLKVGGVLVMPLNDQLLKVTRTGQAEWNTEILLPVTFSPLVIPDLTHPPATLHIPPALFTSLQDLCRREIRSILHYFVEKENPELEQSFNHEVDCSRSSRPEYPDVKMFSEIASDQEDNSDLSDNQDPPHSSYDAHRQVVNQILDLRRSLVSRRSLGHIDHAASIRRIQCHSNKETSSSEENEMPRENCDLLSPQVDIEMTETVKINVHSPTEREKNADESDQGLENSLSEDDDCVSSKELETTIQDNKINQPSCSHNTQKSLPPNYEENASNSSEFDPSQPLAKHESDHPIKIAIPSNSECNLFPTDTVPLDDNALPLTSSSLTCFKPSNEDSLSSHSTCSNSSNKRSRDPESSQALMELEEPKKREKFDSGIGDELEGDVGTSPDDSTEGENKESDSDDSDYMRIPAFKVFSLLNSNCACRERKGYSCSNSRHHIRRKRVSTFKREQKEDDKERQPKESCIKKYSDCMQQKIHLLPLPPPMKRFINLNREM